MTKLNETINPDKFQIIHITSEMKNNYQYLKKYKELIISGETMKWFDAMDYAKNKRAKLPDIKEGKDIAKLVYSNIWTKYYRFWTIEKANNFTLTVDSDGSIHDESCGENDCVCLR